MPRIPVTVAPTGQATQSLGPAQQREHFADRAANTIQSASRVSTSKARALPFGDGNLIAGVSFTGGQTAVINHGLGRAWVGFMVLNRLLVPAPARGTATLASGTVTVTPGHSIVPSASPTAILLAYNTISGTAGHLSAPVGSRTSTTFVIQSDSAADNSTVDWSIVPPWPMDFAGVHNAQTDFATIQITAPYTCTSDVWVY